MGHSEGSFIRWQSITLAQLGYAVNLILSLATASLGFVLALVKDLGNGRGCVAKLFLLLAVVMLALSITSGIWCVLNRLFDFRASAQNAKDRETLDADCALPGSGNAGDNGQAPNKKLTAAERCQIIARIECRRLKTESLGKRTWGLFYLQIAGFGLGAVFVIVTFAVAYRQRIF